MKKFCLLFILFAGSLVSDINAAKRYVDATHWGGTQNGATWSTAFQGMQIAINLSVAGDSVFVAQGNYSGPTMKEGVKLYGGFLNTDTAFSQRNWQLHATRLQGGTGAIIYNMNNNLTTQSVLDGFTFSNFSGYSSPIYNYYSSPTITNCIFINNNILSDALTGGGAIENNASSPIISNCTFTNNHVTNSTQGGGAIHNFNSSAVISNCTFSGNSTSGISAAGAGSYRNNGGAITSVSSTPTIINCVFTANASYSSGNGGNSGMGGAIYNLSSTVNIENCVFQSNTANSSIPNDGNGGAIANYNSASTMKNCVFSSNSASIYGGGVFNSNSTISFVNCLIVKNNALSAGGGIHSQFSNVNLSNCTVASNNAPTGGGLYHIYEPFKILNTIIWGNNSGLTYTNSTGNISYSLVQNMSASAVNHNLDSTTDPFFVDTANGNFQLQALSPCINAGNNDSIPAGITTDLISNPRISNLVVDMGPYEFGGIPLLLDVSQFTGKELMDNSILLQWQLAIEADFELQRSSGDMKFLTINNGTALHEKATVFQYIDAAPDKTSFYRLKLKTRDGFTRYSNVLLFHKSGKNEDQISIYPNPTNRDITLVTGNAQLSQSWAYIINTAGQVVKKIKITNNNQTVSLADLASGIYNLYIAHLGNFKIVKQ